MSLDFRFIISTSKYLLNYHNNTFEAIQNGRGVYFGLSYNKNNILALARNNFDGTGGGNPNSINSIECFDKNLVYKNNVTLDFIKDGHQILCVNDCLYICNSGLNCITKISYDGNISHIIFDSEYGQDIHHYNSINYFDNHWYICQHRTEQGKDNGGVSVYDNDWKFIKYIEVGKHVHNCLIKDGFLWVTKSHDGQLVRIELSNTDNRVEYNMGTGFLSRGLIITDKFLLCGLSEFDTREKRHDSKNGRINIFSYPEIEFLDQMIIQDCGQINDLLLL